MIEPVNPNFTETSAPPVMEARRWLDGVSFDASRPLINVSQAAPMEPPTQELRAAIAEFALNNTDAHLYGPVLGMPDLREAVAKRVSNIYAGQVTADEVAITSGCNQAFTAVMSTVAGPGDEVILPTPWYFNHKMHLDMAGVRTVPLPTGAGMVPDAKTASALITPKTRAIVLVSPNNPTGAEYPGEVLRAFFELAAAHKIALVVDETYRDFDSRDGAPHPLFQDAAWADTLIQLYSFSKAYRLTGHRVGALVCSAERLSQVEKYLDTVAICPNQIGQFAALWGINNLDTWLAGERAETLRRRRAIETEFATIPGWEILGCGAYFAYIRHPFEISSAELAPKLVRDAGILMLPGTMFRPDDDPAGARELRLAFANIGVAEIAELASRLRNLGQ